MRKPLALILAIMMMAAFAARGQNKDKDPGTSDGEKPKREFPSKEMEAVIVAAEAYLARLQYLQYDDTRLVTGGAVVNPPVYRWEVNKRTPEDSTRRMTRYTNCAAFAHDVYLEALGYGIGVWTTWNMNNLQGDMVVYRRRPEAGMSQEDREAMCAEIYEIIEPGDIIVIGRNGTDMGHAMIYVGEYGDGFDIIHSSAPGGDSALGGGNYDYAAKKDNIEPRGSINAWSFHPNLTDKTLSNGRYYLPGMTVVTILRPLNTFTGEIPEKSKNRVENLQGIVVEMLSTHEYGMSVNLDEEMEFSIHVKNTNKWKSNVLEVKAPIPENTAYVEGGDSFDGKNVIWAIEVPKGDSSILTYKVKVKNEESLYGKPVAASCTVGGVDVKCPEIHIKPTLTADEQNKIVGAANKAMASAKRGARLAEEIYLEALGWDMKLGTAKDILEDAFAPYNNTSTHFVLAAGNNYADMVVPDMYGGRNVANSPRFKDRVRGPVSLNFMPGDIIVLAEDGFATKTRVYMRLDELQLLDMTSDTLKVLTLAETRQALMGIIAENRFVVIRPAFARLNLAPPTENSLTN